MEKSFESYIKELYNKSYLTKIEKGILYLDSRVHSQDELIEDFKIKFKELTLSKENEGIKCSNGCDPIQLYEVGDNQFHCKKCNTVFTKSKQEVIK